MKRAVIASLIFLLLCSFVSALHTVAVSSLRSEIFPNETAVFKLSVYSPSDTIQQFMIYSPDVEWGVATDPSKDYIVKVYPNSETEAIVKVTPYVFTNPGLYGVTINVKQIGTDAVVSKKLVLEIKSSKPYGQYVPSVHLAAIVPQEIDPRDSFKVRVNILNQNMINISGLQLELTSMSFAKSYATDLSGLEQKSVDFTIDLDPNTAPIKDTLRLTGSAKVKGKLYEFNAFPVNFEIIEYGKVVQEQTFVKESLVRKTIITLYNDGNSDKQFVCQQPYSIWKALFTYSQPDSDVAKIGGKSYYVWPMVLKPKERAIVTVTVNYWPLVIAFVIVAIIIVAYYVFRSPVVAYKSSEILSLRHGGISELKIQLDVRNRSKTMLRNVHIIDKLPNLLDYQKETKVGLMEPDRVLRHEKKGTILKWDCGSLEPFEERVLTYRAVSRLSILGGLSLPPSFISYDREGIEGSTMSNILYLKMSKEV